MKRREKQEIVQENKKENKRRKKHGRKYDAERITKGTKEKLGMKKKNNKEEMY